MPAAKEGFDATTVAAAAAPMGMEEDTAAA
jgi:hypothetical protein